ncbi:hypothetical protein AB0F96_28130 [Streptomyces sp. NPDC023998]|uniref:hypothetical protein n=1 Tax=unclassified Streptomyces TaxID=2593676 RepID=UPI003253A059
MISEPELVGEDEPFGGAEIPGPRAELNAEPETVGTDDVSRVRRRPLKSWLWALGGAVAASAVWAGGLYAYERPDPDVGAYRTSRNLCVETELKALSTALGKTETPTPTGREHEGMDVAFCWITLRDSTQKQQSYESMPTSAFLTYTLHKKTDPGPEFEASVVSPTTALFGGENQVKLERVQELGERAFFAQAEGDDSPVLHVLDGQAVLTLGVLAGSTPGSDGQEAPTDLSGIKPFMIEDMRTLMAKLQS